MRIVQLSTRSAINRHEASALGINQRRAFITTYRPIKRVHHINGTKLTKSYLSNEFRIKIERLNFQRSVTAMRAFKTNLYISVDNIIYCPDAVLSIQRHTHVQN